MLNEKTVAVIDVGSNSIKLLVARERAEDGPIESVYKKTFETRIGKGISKKNPELTREAIDAGCQSISELVRNARNYDPAAIKIVATSAVRDASNSMEFVERVNDITGIRLDILSGVQEATYIGKGLRHDPQISALDNLVHMDIGGGSLELIRFSQNTIQQACSLQLGAVRLTEKLVPNRTLAIAPETESTIRAHVTETVKNSGFSFEPTTDPMIVTGGAFSVVRSIMAAKTGMEVENPTSVIRAKDISELKSTLCSLPLDKRKTIPGLSKARADVMPVALITIDTVLGLSGRESVTHSSCNLRFGVAAELLENIQVCSNNF
jgi:exopolyphosphatase/guanosine-5'-triphosphate,3'-diphosphate pyrophosphatase